MLEGIFQAYGYDFRHYAPASLKRRLTKRLREEDLGSWSAMLDWLFREPTRMERLLGDLSINVTELFRDPRFYRELREKVAPKLRTYPFVRVWHAGCSTGEEVLSLAIVLAEEGLLKKARIYATDMSQASLERAQSRIVPLDGMAEYSRSYTIAGGKRDFADYYTAGYDGALFNKSLTEHVVYSQHNLATDGSFNEFNLILCRNVMIYFDKHLQSRVHKLLYDSLCMFGILGLGDKETLVGSPYEDCFEAIDTRERIYRKVR